VKYPLFVFLAIVIFGISIPTIASASTSISSCTTLLTPSETYVLTGNIGSGGDCLVVRADDIIIDLASSTITGNVNGNGSSTASVHRQGYRYTIKNGTVTGNVTSRGADGRAGGNGGNGSNGQSSIAEGGSGLGGAGGSAATNGNGTTNDIGVTGDNGPINSIAGSGGSGAPGGTGENGAAGANLVITNMLISGNLNTGGGNGGAGGNGGTGGNGGSLNGSGGSGGDGGTGGNSGAGFGATITNSRIVGTFITSSGNSGTGGNGGNGGNAEPTSADASAGAAGLAGSFGISISVSGLFNITDTTLAGAVTTTPGSCGVLGQYGLPGTALDPLNVPPTGSIDPGCGGATVDPSSSQTVVDHPPYEYSLVGSATMEIPMNTVFDDPGATGTDIKDGSLIAIISGDVNTGYPGRYTRTYAIADMGTTILLNGTPVTYVAPQTAATLTRTIVVTSNGTQIGGGGYSSGGNTNIIYGSAGTNQLIACTIGQKFDILTGRPCINEQLRFTFLKNLFIGMPQNEDIRQLQKWLNAHNFPLAVAPGKPGSVGYETMYFGSATCSAVIRLQNNAQIKPQVGFFGPITRAYVNGLAK
jgi:hypothetical protein